VEKYEVGHHKVWEAVLNLPTGEGKALKAGRDAQVIAYTKVEVGRDYH
jgi:hypothetical protein